MTNADRQQSILESVARARDAIEAEATPQVADPPPQTEARPALPNVTDEEIIDSIPAKILKRDLMRAYQQLGGAQWLAAIAARTPGLFLKELLKLIPQTIDQKNSSGVTIYQFALRPTELDGWTKEEIAKGYFNATAREMIDAEDIPALALKPVKPEP